jgi:hypothetical protein
MTMKTMAALAGALTLCVSVPALAQQNVAERVLSVRSLYEDCKGPNHDFCDGYLSGVARALDHQRSYDQKWHEEYCPPSSGDLSSYRETFISWAEEHREWWEQAQFDGVLLAF